MKPFAFAVSAALLLSQSPAFADVSADEHAEWKNSGDLLQWGIPLAGLGLSFLIGDRGETLPFDLSAFAVEPGEFSEAPGINWPGPRLEHSAPTDFLIAWSRMEVSTYGLKYGINEQRPNGGGHSFPSGHTAAAFMGAEFIRQHSNLWLGVPAYLAAGWVGWTRVDSRAHYWHDVAAGAALGIAANFDFDSVETRYGQLSFGPALLEETPAQPLHVDALQNNPVEVAPALMPGLRLELRF